MLQLLDVLSKSNQQEPQSNLSMAIRSLSGKMIVRTARYPVEIERGYFVPLNLLSPANLQLNYINQLRQTIAAYDPAHVVFGEALQNSLDAIVEAGPGHHTIKVTLDIDQRTVIVEDDGIGFPNVPTLLFLGGTKKTGKKLLGLIGVGIKVVLFRSSLFRIRSQMPEAGDSFRFEVADGYRFEDEPPPEILIPDRFPEDPDL